MKRRELESYEQSCEYRNSSQPDNELFTFTYFNHLDEHQTVIVYLTIHPAERLADREIYAEIKLPFKIALDPKSDVAYQLSSALYLEGIKGELKSVSYIVNGEQVTI